MFYQLEYAEKIQETGFCQDLFNNYHKASDYLKAVHEYFKTIYLDSNEFQKKFLDNLSQIILAKEINSVLFVLAALRVAYEQGLKKDSPQVDPSALYLVFANSDLEKELRNLDIQIQPGSE